MNKAAIGLRLIFGLWMLVNGLNYFFNFFPLPLLSPATIRFISALDESGIFAVAKVIEVIVGVLLLLNVFVPAAIAASMPLSVIIFYTDVILERSLAGHASGILLLAANVLLMYNYSKHFESLLTYRSSPTTAKSSRRVN